MPRAAEPAAALAMHRPCTEPSSRRRDLHLCLMALIKYSSLMPLYIYSVSLERHKASFTGLRDERSERYLPGTFWEEQEGH